MNRWLAALPLACLLAHPAQAAKPWQTLSGCRLVEHGANDGNSFHVRWKGSELTVRLYFADTPEVDTRFRDRTKAKAFTREALKGGFSIRTRWQGVFSGRKGARKYGIVSVGGQDLADWAGAA